MSQIITRFPPSPTGYLHIGRARTALFNYLFARHNSGTMVFRVEDTDKERSKKEYEDNIIECLKWLGITYDSGPFRQSERNEIYKKYLRQMIDSGHAYVSTEVVEEGRRSEVIRFKNPNKKVTFTDLIRGDIEFDTTDLKDFIIAKSVEEPLYHLAVVVDDFLMGVTHIIRGEDGISNTPRQILIQEAIGAPRPLYAHIPLILAPDKSKLSGRHGAVSVTEYRNQGFLPEAVVNYLALLGWNPGTDQELFGADELVKVFDLSKVQKSGAVFDVEKLKWFNRQYIVKLSDVDFVSHAAPFLPEWIGTSGSLMKKLVPILRAKIATFAEISPLFVPGGELAFVAGIQKYSTDMLLWKKNPSREEAREHLVAVRKIFDDIPEIPDNSDQAFDAASVKAALWPYAEAKGKGDVLWPLRVSLSGQEKSPDPFIIAEILGKQESQKRIDAALALLG